MSDLSSPTDQMKTTAQKRQPPVPNGQDYQSDLKQWLACANHLPHPLRESVVSSIQIWDKHVQDVYKRLHTLATQLHTGAPDRQTTDVNHAKDPKPVRKVK